MTPPTEPVADILAETQVLGGCLLDGRQVAQALERVQPGDFHRPAHQMLFAALVDLEQTGQPIDLASMAQYLSQRALWQRHWPSEQEAREYVFTLADSTPAAANVPKYAADVRRAAQLRALSMAGLDLHRNASDPTADPGDVAGQVEQSLYGIITQRSRHGQGMSAGQAARLALERSEAVGRGEREPGLMTGFPLLDSALVGLQPGDVCAIAGTFSSGKSSLALGLAARWAEAGKLCLYVTAEMTEQELGHRLLARTARVDSSAIKAGRLTREQAQAVAAADQRIQSWPLELWAGCPTIAEIAAKARRLGTGKGLALGAVVVDYLQLMTPAGGSRDNREREVAGTAWACKQMALELGCPVLALSQLSRDHQKAHRLPGAFDLRESGAIEQTSNQVLLIVRPDPPEPPETDGAELVWLRVAKCRDGRVTGWPRAGQDDSGIRLRFYPAQLRFEAKRLSTEKESSE
jgi:replicative DNA helicase